MRSHTQPCLCATIPACECTTEGHTDAHQYRHQLWEDPPVCTGPQVHGHTHLSLMPGEGTASLPTHPGLCWGTGLPLPQASAPPRGPRLPEAKECMNLGGPSRSDTRGRGTIPEGLSVPGAPGPPPSQIPTPLDTEVSHVTGSTTDASVVWAGDHCPPSLSQAALPAPDHDESNSRVTHPQKL